VWQHVGTGYEAADFNKSVQLDHLRSFFPIAVQAVGFNVAAKKFWSKKEGQPVFAHKGIVDAPRCFFERGGNYVNYTCRLISADTLEVDIGEGIVTLPVSPQGTVVWEGKEEALFYAYSPGTWLRHLPV
jgi:hypothetical protein